MSQNNDVSCNDNGWPEEPSGKTSCGALIYRRWTYSFMNKVLNQGSKQKKKDGTHLCQDDLFRVPCKMESAYLTSKFDSEYIKRKSLKRTLWQMGKEHFVPAGFCQLLSVSCQVAIPLIVREFLMILEDNPEENVLKDGLPYALLIFFFSVVNAFSIHRQRHLATKTGVLIRLTMVSVIYNHALCLTPYGRSGLTTGEITNLVATDTQKLFEVTQEGHYIWSCPLSMILVTILLLLIMGPTTLVGMAVLFLFVPVAKWLVSCQMDVRHNRVKVTDERVEIISAMLQGMKVTKLNNYEKRYQERIEDARNREIKLLRKELFFYGLTLVITVLSPVLASGATFATFVLTSEDNILTVSETFTVLLLFIALRFPINYTGRLIGRAAQALDAARRLSEFLSREVHSDSNLEHEERQATTTSIEGTKSSLAVLSVEKGTFQLESRPATEVSEISSLDESEDNGFILSNVNFSLSAGQILAICGPVGSGKSTLINGIIGEVSSSADTRISKYGAVSYAAQIPFILNTTLRENILFGLPYEKERYEQVLDDCCLRPDIEQLKQAGDLTEIGERGITLSGGQKQRVSLARAAYSRSKIVLLDDPLSALDASTQKAIFDRLFKSSGNNLLKDSAVVLVTHASHFLNRVDRTMVIVEGNVKFLGSWKELMDFHCNDASTMAVINSIQSSVQEGEETTLSSKCDGCHSSTWSGKTKSEKNSVASGELMTIETREYGLSSFSTWFIWFANAGGIMFVIVQLILMIVDRSSYVATEWWLAQWTKGSDQPVTVFGIEFNAQTEGMSAQYQYLKVYAIIILISIVFTILRTQWALMGGARSAKRIFSLALSRLIFAPMSYFETTPLGRVLNRFTFDIEVIDITLTENMSVVMIASSWYVAGVLVMTVILPWMILAIVPVTVMYGFVTLHYRRSGADLQRLDAVSRSPVQAMLAEGLDGASTIRAFRQQINFLHRFHAAADANSSAMLNFVSAQRWLGLRIELLGSLIVLCSSVLVVCLNDVIKVEAGLVALLIIWSSNFTVTLNFLVDSISESEAAITSLERVYDTTRLPQEKSMLTDDTRTPPASWPDGGCIEFENVSLRYRNGLPLALNGLSFKVKPGTRCGVVGRTGAGKSTLTTALFRLAELESGRILLDGIDLSTLGLSDVRGRPNGMSIIPQDPVLFAGALRECLDPFGSSSDAEIIEAIAAVRLSGFQRGEKMLDDIVEEGGRNFSVGERQLICLARALLSRPKVLVMDEATASVDGETDSFIQNMLRTRFSETTLLTIAHRLHTIMDYDVVLVMDDGKAVEFDSPSSLLQDDGSVFRNLVDSTGEESARALWKMAMSSSEK